MVPVLLGLALDFDLVEVGALLVLVLDVIDLVPVLYGHVRIQVERGMLLCQNAVDCGGPKNLTMMGEYSLLC